MKKFTLAAGEFYFTTGIIRTMNKAELEKEIDDVNIDLIAAREFLINSMLDGDLTDDMLYVTIEITEREYDLLMRCLRMFRHFCQETDESEAYFIIKRVIDKVRDVQ